MNRLYVVYLDACDEGYSFFFFFFRTGDSKDLQKKALILPIFSDAGN